MNLPIFNNKLMLAVDASKDHGKTESTKMLIDLLYITLVTKHQGWKAELYNSRTDSFAPYCLTKQRSNDLFVVFSYHNKRKIAIITGGDTWETKHHLTHVAKSWQELLVSHDVKVKPMVLHDSLEIVVGSCHQNNDVNKKLKEIANESGYEMVETSPYYQVHNETSIHSQLPRFVWKYLFANHLLEIVLSRLSCAGIISTSAIFGRTAGSFSQEMTPLVFAMMEDFKQEKDGFGFEERQKNNAERMTKGLMFHGNDDYIRVSLSSKRADTMHTTTLGLEFIHNSETGDIACMLEVVCDNSDEQLPEYQELVSLISTEGPWRAVSCKDRYLMQLFFHKTKDYLDAVVKARKFLQDNTLAFKKALKKDILFIN
ncbi:hypothetical protein [uncultured Prevotella sp.]|uniref:hypothetical protein n=1 Tax=uncultured Prevotella sp. TaxID=159272 RepID=UPI0026340717|nr:hypothetical protein [uncultured Prevotella sp.]